MQQQHQELLPFRLHAANVLNLMWSLASLLSVAHVPIAESEALSLLRDILSYIAHENDPSVLHASICALYIMMNRLFLPASAVAQASSPAVDAPASLNNKSSTARVLLDIVSQVLQMHQFVYRMRSTSAATMRPGLQSSSSASRLFGRRWALTRQGNAPQAERSSGCSASIVAFWKNSIFNVSNSF
jgi:hypothetical protein